ncbi:thioredoxin domain-containing protein 5 homolog [Bombyx mori]|uniref:Thioredoxin domain-containing protein n=1 Tax=Bombyx mori TaxID=7091 RepID=A0A8R2QY76_BOMMO|nr:thioredoxin domain-containing protein 5 homolog isoform X2 [Bombyx mori]
MKILPYLFVFPYLVAPEQSSVYEYNPSNFKFQIEEMDGNFIMFYAPWCRHCTEFYPIWSELAELVNTKDSKFAIAQVDCTVHAKLCHENEITGYPTLFYFHKNTFTPVEYKGTRDLPSLTLFLSEAFSVKTEGKQSKQPNEVKTYSGMSYLNDLNIEKFVSKGQHFIMFFVPWCRASQRMAPIWADLAVHYAHNNYIKIGKVNCMDNEITCENFEVKQYPYLLWIVNGKIMGASNGENLDDLKAFVEKMLLSENHDPEKFLRKKKALPVARISEETFETFLQNDLVFINYFAPWCAHCMQLSPLWIKLGEKFQNETRVLIADVDCVQSKPICETEKINGLPTLILYRHKKIVSVEHGGRPLDSLIGLITEHLQDSASTDPEDKTNEDIFLSKAKDEL